MSCLHRLGLSGVRSYDADKQAVIDFTKPLTLILGQNGAGKTTIIESLKLLTTGTFPPGSNGGKTFVLDPKFKSRPEVIAQVKLIFQALNKKKLFAMKSFQISRAHQQLQFKTKENIIKTKNTKGEDITVNHQCNQIEKTISELLGVSKAVLENVIFCHQEESLWCFGDNLTLKNIFDNLFDTTQFTKIIDMMLKQQKEIQKEMKEQQILQKPREDSYRDEITKREQLHVEGELLVQLSEKVKQLRNSKTQCEQELNQYTQEEEVDLQQVTTNMKVFEYKQYECLEEIANLQSQVPQERQVFSKEKLDQDLQQFEHQIKLKDEQLNKLKEELEQKINPFLQRKMDELKKLEEVPQIDSAKRQLMLACDRAREVLHMYGNLQQQFQSQQIQEEELSTALDTLLEEISNTHTLARSKAEEARAAAETLLRNAQQEQNTLKVNLEMKQLSEKDWRNKQEEATRSTQSNEKKLNEYFPEVQKKRDALAQQVGILENQLKELQTKQATLRDRQNQLQLQASAGYAGQAIRVARREHREFKELLLTKRGVQEYEQREWDNRLQKGGEGQKIVESLAQHQAFKQFFQSLKANFYTVDGNLADRASTELRIAQNRLAQQCQTQQRVFMTQEAKYNHAIELAGQSGRRIADKKSELEIGGLIQQQQANQNGFGGYNTLLANLNQELTDSQTELIQKRFVHEQLYTHIAEKSRHTGTCAFCEQSVSEDILQKLEKKFIDGSEETQGEIQELQQKVEDLKAKKRALKNNRAEVEEFERLQAEAQKLQKTIVEEKIVWSHQKVELDKIEDQRLAVVQGSKFVEDIVKSAAILETLSQELKNTNAKVRALEAQHVELGRERDGESPSTSSDGEEDTLEEDQKQKSCLRALEQAAQELQDCSARQSAIQTQLLREHVQLQQQEHLLQNEKSVVEGKLTEALQVKKQAESELKTLHQDLASLRKREEIILTNEVPLIMRNMQEIQRERDLRSEEYHKKSEELKAAREALANSAREFQELQLIVQQSTSPQQQEKKNQLKKDIERLQKGVQKMVEQIRDLERTVEQEQFEAQGLRQAVEYAEKCEILEEIKQEIQRLDIVKTKLLKSEEKKGIARQRLQQIEIDLARLSSEANYRLNQYRINKVQSEQRLVKAEKDYYAGKLEVDVREAAIQDLSLYLKALEQTLLDFHREKMIEINKIITDTWHEVHSGIGIRNIEIKSDTETDEKKRTKSYNYRIVMQSANKEELDMKGRCSMGQKVLASIVIRLALSEAFSVNCGILALDEPTANLDKQHVQTLADQLGKLIEWKREQNADNFQLIVITHDQEFISMLSEYTDHYYHVKKNLEGFSIIEHKPIPSNGRITYGK